MKRILRSRTVLVTAGLSLVGSLAGCASTTSTDAAGSASSSGTSANSTSDNTSPYEDGTYSADAAYAAPGGDDEIAVSLTIRSNIITAVGVTTVSAHDGGVRYAAQFEAAISSVAVGESLATLSVTNVAGSSLTSQGFNSALETIRVKAKA